MYTEQMVNDSLIQVLMLQRCGIADGLIRLACGIEASEDLIQDLEQALATIGGKSNAAGSNNGTKKGTQAVKKTGRARATSSSATSAKGASRNGASRSAASANGVANNVVSANGIAANGASSNSSSIVNGAGVQHNKEILREV